jgi:hypothetical protein
MGAGTALALLAVLVWREGSFRGERELARAEWATVSARAEADAAELAGERERAGALEQTVAELEAAAQSLQDRAANLEAQRDHLRAEGDRQAGRAGELSEALEQARGELQACRRELLEQAALPRELRAQLQQARAQVAHLEGLLDQRATADSDLPTALEVKGISADETVFSLAGDRLPGGALPLPVHLCRGDRILLDGWIHRIEDNRAIGHVAHWREPASALVNGAKVFILPRHGYEAD